jgi:bla regulator protein BlaR1
MHLLESTALWTWDNSLAASILILPALLLRKTSWVSIRHLIGLLIIARLLLPLALPSSTSIFNYIVPKQPVAAPPARPVSPAPALPLISITPEPRVPVLPAIWFVGVCLLLARVLAQHAKVRRWTRPENLVKSGPVVELLKVLSVRPVRLYANEGIRTPALFGLFWPAILLPLELIQNANTTRLRIVLLHELAHMRRKDVLVNWLMIFAQALHWFNPLVWLAFRRLRADQEILCDTDVMRCLRPEEHRVYGETLLALASPRVPALSPLIPVSSNFKQLKERIAMIKQFKPASRRLFLFVAPTVAALIAVLTFTAAVDKKASPQRVEKKPTAPQAADEKLQRLEEQFAIETERVRIAESQVDGLRKRLGIFANSEADLLKESETFRRLEMDRIRAQQEYAQFKQLHSSLKSKKSDELVQTIPTAYRDQMLDGLLEKLLTAEQQLAVLSKEKSEDHPESQRVQATLKQLDRQINERVKGILSGLETLVSSRKSVVDSLDDQLAVMKKMESEMLERARPYFTAKRDLETHQKMRDAIYLRLLEQKAERALAR